MIRFPEILLVCEDQNLMEGFHGLVADAHPDIKIHCIDPNAPETWDMAVKSTMDKPRIAFVGLKPNTMERALNLRLRPNSADLPWIVLLHPEMSSKDLEGYHVPYARVRLHWESDRREAEMATLFRFLSICQFT